MQGKTIVIKRNKSDSIDDKRTDRQSLVKYKNEERYKTKGFQFNINVKE